MLTDHRGNDQGSLSVVLTPCTKKGSPLGDDYFVEDPKELLDKGICLIIPTRDFLVAPQSILDRKMVRKICPVHLVEILQRG